MKTEQVQVEVDDLAKGMYVCALDRPWLSTPFPFQGFVIRTEKEIRALKQYCNYVYVDVLRGIPPAPEAGLRRAWRRRAEQGTAPDAGDGAANDGQAAVEGSDDRPMRDMRSVVQSAAARGRTPASQIKSVPVPIHRDRYEPPKALKRELRRAVEVHRELSRSVGQVIDDVRIGRGVDASMVRRATEQMVDSILRHPDALIWLGRLRENDGYAYAHSVRSSILSVAVARHMGLHGPQMQRLAMGTLLCEIGKARLPRHLLEKRGPLAEAEIQRLQDHVPYGVEILGRCPGLEDDVVEVVATHHERYDGTGYPNGLYGDQIPLLGRIAGMVDCYDAMTTLRPYTNRVYTSSEAIDYFYGQRDHQFQTQLVDEFIQAIGLYPTGTLVELSNGETALVIEQDLGQRLQPVVLVVLDAEKRPVDPPRRANLKELSGGDGDQPVSIVRALAAGEHGLDASRLLEAYATNRWDWRRLVFR